MSDTPISDEQKKEEEERKGGAAIPPWMRGAADIRVGGAGTLGGSGGGLLGAGGAALGSRGVMGALLSFLQSKALLVSAIALSMFGSLYGLSSQKQSGFGPGRGSGKGLFGSARDSRITLPGGQTRDLSALELARMANKGAFDSGEGNAASGQEGAQAQDASASQPPEAGAAAAGDPMAGAADLAAAAGGLPPGVGDMSKGLEGGRLAGMGALGSMAGGGGSGASMALGGPSGAGKPEDASTGQTRAFSNPAGAKTIAAKTPINTGRTALKGASAKRLAQLSSAVGPTKTAGPEIGAATQSRAWEAAPDAGKSLGGNGLSQGSGNAGNSGFSSKEGNEGGGPVNSGSSSGDSAWNDKEVAPPTKAAPWTQYQDLVDIATKALEIATVLTMIAFGLHLLAKIPVLAPYAFPAAAAASAAAAAAAAVAMGCGLIIAASYGQILQGAIFAGVGGLVAFLSIRAAMQDAKAATASKTAQQVGKKIGEEAAKKLGQETAKKTVLDAATKEAVKEGLKYTGKAALQYGGTAAVADVGKTVGKGLEAAPPEGAEKGKHIWENLWTEQAPGSGADRASALDQGIKDTGSKLGDAFEKEKKNSILSKLWPF